MSLDLENRLRVFLSSAPQTVRSIMTLQISHSAMSKTYHLWREPPGQTVTDEGVVQMQGLNMDIKLAGSEGNLDQQFSIRIDTVDIEDEFREQLDRIPIDTAENIRIVYREYLSDDLTQPQAQVTLQAESISYQIGAATISAVAPRLNSSRTGELYSPRDVPMLRGFN